MYTHVSMFQDISFEFINMHRCCSRMVLWSESTPIAALLVFALLGHWSLILQGMASDKYIAAELRYVPLVDSMVDANWAAGSGCTISRVNNSVRAAAYIYSMALDVLILILTMIKLQGWNRRTQLDLRICVESS